MLTLKLFEVIAVFFVVYRAR